MLFQFTFRCCIEEFQCICIASLLCICIECSVLSSRAFINQSDSFFCWTAKNKLRAGYVCFHNAQHTASKRSNLSNYLQRFTNTSIMMQYLLQRSKLILYQLATPNTILRFVLLSSKINWKYEAHFVMEILMKNCTVELGNKLCQLKLS